MTRSAAADQRRQAELTTLVGQLDELAADQLDTADAVDREILRTEAGSELLRLAEIDEPSWNAMLHNPGQAMYAAAVAGVRAAAANGWPAWPAGCARCPTTWPRPGTG